VSSRPPRRRRRSLTARLFSALLSLFLFALPGSVVVLMRLGDSRRRRLREQDRSWADHVLGISPEPALLQIEAAREELFEEPYDELIEAALAAELVPAPVPAAAVAAPAATRGRRLLSAGGLGRASRRLTGGLLSAAIVVVPAGVFVKESLGDVMTQLPAKTVQLSPSALARYAALTPYKGAVPVVTYHDISNSGTRYAVTPEHFAAQLAMLHAAGFHTITAAQFTSFLAGSGTLPSKPIMLTFDDGASSAWRVADPLLERYGMHAVIFVITSEIGRHAPYYLTSAQLNSLRDSGRWDLEAHTDNGHHSVQSSPDGAAGPFLTTREWLPAFDRYETLAEYTTRVREDLDRCLEKLHARGVNPQLFAFPFSAATTPTNDPRVIPILYRLVAERFTASLVDSADHQYVTRVLGQRYELPRFLVRATSTPDSVFADLASTAPRPQLGNIAGQSHNWVVDQPSLRSSLAASGGLSFDPPTRTWISAHWAPRNALPVHDATLQLQATKLGTNRRGSAVTLLLRPDGNDLPATVTVGPATLKIRGTTTVSCDLPPASSHQLEVSYTGRTLQVAVDDHRASTIRFATSDGSGIGIGAWRDSAASPRPLVTALVRSDVTPLSTGPASPLHCALDTVPPAAATTPHATTTSPTTAPVTASTTTHGRRTRRSR
jgi:peptidoglycan/xylan/chitin deacetylase (PgdA/CDA1 family)